MLTIAPLALLRSSLSLVAIAGLCLFSLLSLSLYVSLVALSDAQPARNRVRRPHGTASSRSRTLPTTGRPTATAHRHSYIGAVREFVHEGTG